MDEKQHLCDVCREIPITDYFRPGRYPEAIELGPYQTILAKKNCSFCMLIIAALSINSRDYWKEGEYPIEMCYLGRRQEESSAPILEVWFISTPATSPSSLMGSFAPVGQILPLGLDEGTDKSAGDGYQVYGRLVDDQINLPLLQNWIQDCTLNHGEICKPRNIEVDCERFLVLVDVWRMCLVKRDWGSRYLALSYVWGNVDTFSTTKGNIEDLQEEDAILRNIDKVEQVIKDAIELVRRIGETYLWVDRLSVVQDDEQFKLECIPHMDKIFGQALITIVALSDRDGSSKLPGISAGSRSVTQSTMKLGALTLVARLQSLVFAELTTRWNERAWTYQEGILSRRKVYLSDSQMFWCCPGSYSTEDCSLASDDQRDLSRLTRILGGDLDAQFCAYQILVRRFAPRKMTYASDSLNAFAGILSALKESFAWDFASALPESCLDKALLWATRNSMEQRPRSLHGPDSYRMVCTSPTWCWSAWRGHLDWDLWRIDSFAGKEVNIKSSVQKFMIDHGGERRLVSCRPADKDHESNGKREAETKHTGYNHSAPMILLFEAKACRLQSFKISKWRPKGQLQGIDEEEDIGDIHNYADISLWLCDNNGHHCGNIDGIGHMSTPSPNVAQYEMVELSRCDQDEITEADIDTYWDDEPRYSSAAEYYDEMFDVTRYSYQRCWAVNFMLLEWKGEVAERVAIGQIHADAWDAVHQGMKQIALA